MKEIVLAILFVLFVALSAYGGFRLYRWFNWTYGYEDMVRTTIHMEVKPECLKGG